MLLKVVAHNRKAACAQQVLIHELLASLKVGAQADAQQRQVAARREKVACGSSRAFTGHGPMALAEAITPDRPVKAAHRLALDWHAGLPHLPPKSQARQFLPQRVTLRAGEKESCLLRSANV